MPVAKLSSLSNADIRKTQDEHWDIDMKIRDILTLLTLDQKKKLLLKLPGVITGIGDGERVDINTGE